MLKIPAYCLPLSNSETQVSSSITCILQFKGTYSQGFSIERHCEHWLCPGTTSSGKILTISHIRLVEKSSDSLKLEMGEKLESMISTESSEAFPNLPIPAPYIFDLMTFVKPCCQKRVVVQVAPEALLEEKNFFLALGIHKPHQVPDKRNI